MGDLFATTVFVVQEKLLLLLPRSSGTSACSDSLPMLTTVYYTIKGTGICAYIFLGSSFEENEEFFPEFHMMVRSEIFGCSSPDSIERFASDGKITRPLIRKIVKGKRKVLSINTLADPTVINTLIEMFEAPQMKK